MTIRIPDEGEAKMLAVLLGKDASENLSVRLYTNNYTPVEGSTAASFTQLSGSGYAAVTLTPASWTVTPGAPSAAGYPQITWTFTAAASSCYGYYVVGATSGVCYFAERFTNGPFAITQSGDSIRVTLNLTLQDTQD